MAHHKQYKLTAEKANATRKKMPNQLREQQLDMKSERAGTTIGLRVSP